MLAEMVGEVVIVTLLVSEGDQVVIVVMGLLMNKVEEVEMALTAISLETTVEGVVGCPPGKGGNGGTGYFSERFRKKRKFHLRTLDYFLLFLNR